MFDWVTCLPGPTYHGESIKTNDLLGDSISEEKHHIWGSKLVLNFVSPSVCHTCSPKCKHSKRKMSIFLSLAVINLFILRFLYEVMP